jgi:hypothetical protein
LTDIGHQATDDIEKLRIAGKVCGKTVGSPAQTSRLRRDKFERLQSAADEANSNSLRRERQGNRLADPAPAARDNRSLVREIVHRTFASN